MNNLGDQFDPIGMSILAVDDDQICLNTLETLLLKCQYHVTTATNAITALDLLRKNKKKFDLVISDVHMPDMDGFKLLQLIALEMDLPVIMLSANDDPKMVTKGISHGACYYLPKPVRIEEIKNIWLHVIRKKKKKITKTIIQDAPKSDSCKKRKEHSHDDDDNDGDIEENVNDHHGEEDLPVHKRPRVVWSVELHRKFLAAVNQLGVNKAVPKKILALMNVENLTRENVASHLQKYRLYMKRNNCVENQQANMVAFSGSRQFQNNAFTSFQASNVNVHGMPSSATFQASNVNVPNNALMLEPKVGGPYNNLATHHSEFSPSLLGNDIWSSAVKSQGVSSNVWINHNQDGINHYNVNGSSIVSSSSICANDGGELEGMLDFNFGEPLGMNQHKFQNSGISSEYGSLEDMLSIVMQKPDNVKLLDGYMYDNYSDGTFM